MLTREITVLDPRTGETVGRVPIAAAARGRAGRCAGRRARRRRLGPHPGRRTGRRAARRRVGRPGRRRRARRASPTRETGKPPTTRAAGSTPASARWAVRRAGPAAPRPHPARRLGRRRLRWCPSPRGVVAVLTPWNDPVAVACGPARRRAGHRQHRRPQAQRALPAHRPPVRRAPRRAPARRRAGDPRRRRRGRRAARRAPDVDVVAHVGSLGDRPGDRAACARTGAKAAAGERRQRPADRRRGRRPGLGGGAGRARGLRQRRADLRLGRAHLRATPRSPTPFLAALVAEAARVAGPARSARRPPAARRTCTATWPTAVAAGARALTGGEVPDGPGAYYPPTVLTGCTPRDAR